MFKKFKKKHIIYASLLIGIFSLFMFSTIVYSAINGTVKISGNAYARVEADARITDFRLASSNNATSSYEEFEYEDLDYLYFIYSDYDSYGDESYDIKVEIAANNGFMYAGYETVYTECFVAGTKVLV